MSKKRFQDCNIFIKLYRMIRYIPPNFIKGVCYGLAIKNMRHAFNLFIGMWQADADWVYTQEEVREHLKRR